MFQFAMDSIETLEKLIIEFYNPHISSQRRKEIDNTLQNYESTPIPWKECVQYVEEGRNALVSAFCLKMIDSLISKHWNKLPVNDKTLLHSSLSNHLFHSHSNMQSSIRKQIMISLSKIIRNEWSTMGFCFVSDIMKMISLDDVQMVIFGLNFLLIASEELIEPRDIMCSAKKQDIRRDFESNIPQIFFLLNGTFRKYKGLPVEEQVYEISLQVCCQLFSWVPLSDVYVVDMLSPMYDCTMHTSYRIRMFALTAINEILYKNCVPMKNVPLITNICHKLNAVLLQVSKSGTETVDDEYVGKILEAVSLILSFHWHRVESNMEPANIIMFLSSFYKLSFHNINRQSYRACLDIWCTFLEYLSMRDAIHKQQYENLLNTLLEQIIRKLYEELYLHENAEKYQEEEEWDAFFNQNMNVVDSIVELSPQRSFTLIIELWNHSKSFYTQVWSSLEDIGGSVVNNKDILDALYAFRISTQILTSLHSKSPDEVKIAITKDLVNILNFSASKYLGASYNNCNHLHSHCIKVYCSLLKATPIWIGDSKLENSATVSDVFSLMLPFIMNSTNISVHEELQVAVAELIFKLTVHLTQANLIQPLFIDPTFKYLPISARKHLQCALCYWVCDTKNESYRERLKFLSNLFQTVARNKLEDLASLCSIVQNCNVTKSEGKELLFNALEPWLEYVSQQFPFNFAKQPQVCNTSLTFLLEVVRIFQNNVKPYFVEKMLLTFESCFSNLTDGNTYCQGFEKILMIFTLLMENPGCAYNEYIPKILHIAQNVLFWTRERKIRTSNVEDNVDVEFYKLLCCILINKWPYFNNVSRSLSGIESSQRYQEVDAILSRILESFGELDINIFRSNLRCLEEMNTKWNFYDKEIFRGKHLSPMLNILLLTLIEGKHKLLTDEILSAIFHIAAINFEIFYNNYIPSLLTNSGSLTEHQIHVLRNNFNLQTDFPTFVQSLSRLINDIRSYHLENGC